MNASNILALLHVAFGILLLNEQARTQPSKIGTKETRPRVDCESTYVTFEVYDKPLAEVIEWLAKETGLELVGKKPSRRSFTFISPTDGKGKLRLFTLAQVADIVGERMADEHKLLLVRGESTLRIVDPDAPGDAVDFEKTCIAFDMREKRWSSVFDWLSEQARMPIGSKGRVLKGTFTFVNPKDGKGKLREYTLKEIVGIINETLAAEHKFMIMRHDLSLVIVAADAVPPPYLWRIETTDTPQKAEPIDVPAVDFRYHTVPRGNADEMLNQLQKLITDKNVRMQAAGPNRLFVYGRPEMHKLVALMIKYESGSTSPTPTIVPRASPPRRATACCESAPHCREGLLARLLRR